MLEKEMVGERKLWAAVVSHVARDLRSANNVYALKAALYFFREGNDSDTQLRTFNGVCRAHNLDPDKAAKKIWSMLKPNQQERIKSLLRKSGYEVRIN